MLNITLSEEEAMVVIDSLTAVAEKIDSESFSNYIPKELSEKAIENHRISELISSQVKSEIERKDRLENQQKKIDPFDDPDWRPNDPRGW